jgi:hypothetical protein
MTMLVVGTRSQLCMNWIAQAGEYGLCRSKGQISSENGADVWGIGAFLSDIYLMCGGC